MVGEQGSAFKNAGGGVSSWIQETLGPKLAICWMDILGCTYALYCI
ncbi:MAG: hypothetical protein ACLRQF_04875 [Thomasclavelia ramosa]